MTQKTSAPSCQRPEVYNRGQHVAAPKRSLRPKFLLVVFSSDTNLGQSLNSLSLGFLTHESRYYLLSSLLQSCVHSPIHSVHPSIQHILIEHQLHCRGYDGPWEYPLTWSQPWEVTDWWSVTIKTATVHCEQCRQVLTLSPFIHYCV